MKNIKKKLIFTSGILADFLSLIFFQSIPTKKGCALISSTPLIPNLSSN